MAPPWTSAERQGSTFGSIYKSHNGPTASAFIPHAGLKQKLNIASQREADTHSHIPPVPTQTFILLHHRLSAMGTAASSSNQTSRPGFGRRVDDETLSAEGGGGGPYEHALASAPFQSRGVTVRERRMLEFMGQITDKPEWQRKVHDEGILGKWREEAARVIDVDGIRDVYLSEQMFDYVSLVWPGLVAPSVTQSEIAGGRICADFGIRNAIVHQGTARQGRVLRENGHRHRPRRGTVSRQIRHDRASRAPRAS